MDQPIATADRLAGAHAPRPVSGQLVRTALPMVLLVTSVALLYWSVLDSLVRDWASDPNYSHGFLIPPLALYLAWERRKRVAALETRPSLLGLLIIIGSLGALAAGTLGAELFLTRASLLGVIAGGVVFLYGWRHLRALSLPIALLLLMIPLPVLIFNQIAFPLQLLASQVGEFVLMAFQIPVLREGNIMVLAHTTLEVAEACSGIRSLMSLITLGIVYGYFAESRNGVRVVIGLSTVPVAIAANALRVAGTGVAAQYFGPQAAEGFFHTFSGWLVFIVAFAAIFGIRHLVVSGIALAGRVRPRTRTA